MLCDETKAVKHLRSESSGSAGLVESWGGRRSRAWAGARNTMQVDFYSVHGVDLKPLQPFLYRLLLLVDSVCVCVIARLQIPASGSMRVKGNMEQKKVNPRFELVWHRLLDINLQYSI